MENSVWVSSPPEACASPKDAEVGTKGVRFAASKRVNPTTMMTRTMPTFTYVRTPVNRAESLDPDARTIARTTKSAAVPQSKTTPPIDTVLWIPVACPVASVPPSPTRARNWSKYSPHAFATTAAAKNISRMRSQPMIHAMNSPIEA